MKKGAGRAKGTRFELNTAKQISVALGFQYGKEIRRTPNSGALTTRSDLWVSPKKRPFFPFFIENKARQLWRFENASIQNEKWLPFVWLREAETKLLVDPEYEPDAPVLLLFTRNHAPVFVLYREEQILTVSPYTNTNFMLRLPKLNVVCILWDDFLFAWQKHILKQE